VAILGLSTKTSDALEIRRIPKPKTVLLEAKRCKEYAMR
jgi:hypothetical protein